MKAGRFELFLTMFDSIPGTSIYCDRTWPDKDTTILPEFRRRIVVIVKPLAPANFSISDSVVCRNEPILFTSTSDSIYTRYTWSFGDGDTAVRNITKTVSHSYATVGPKIVSLKPDYDVPGFEKKCIETITKTVQVVEVESKFTVDSLNQPIFCFKNLSTGANAYRWDFNNKQAGISTSTDFEPCHSYGETLGEFEV